MCHFLGTHLDRGEEHWRIRDEIFDLLCRLRYHRDAAQTVWQLRISAHKVPAWRQVCCTNLASRSWADFETYPWQRLFAVLLLVQKWLKKWPV